MPTIVQVDIHGHRYSVRSELEPKYIHELAHFLDEKMRAAARELASADPLRIAVIAALNLADELHRARADRSGTERHLHVRAQAIEELIDSVLEDARLKVVNE